MGERCRLDAVPSKKSAVGALTGAMRRMPTGLSTGPPGLGNSGVGAGGRVAVKAPVGVVPFPDGAATIVWGPASDFPDARHVDVAGGVGVGREWGRRGWRAGRRRHVGGAEGPETTNPAIPLGGNRRNLPRSCVPATGSLTADVGKRVGQGSVRELRWRMVSRGAAAGALSGWARLLLEAAAES